MKKGQKRKPKKEKKEIADKYLDPYSARFRKQIREQLEIIQKEYNV